MRYLMLAFLLVACTDHDDAPCADAGPDAAEHVCKVDDVDLGACKAIQPGATVAYLCPYDTDPPAGMDCFKDADVPWTCCCPQGMCHQ